jgi:hypothetical protein
MSDGNRLALFFHQASGPDLADTLLIGLTPVQALALVARHGLHR